MTRWAIAILTVLAFFTICVVKTNHSAPEHPLGFGSSSPLTEITPSYSSKNPSAIVALASTTEKEIWKFISDRGIYVDRILARRPANRPAAVLWRHRVI